MFRILNAFAHVIDEQQPGPPQMKTALPSLPTAPSLSPIKRKAKGEKETGSAPNTPSQDAKNAAKPSQKGEYVHFSVDNYMGTLIYFYFKTKFLNYP